MSDDTKYRMARAGAVYLFSIGASDYAMEFLRDYFTGLGMTDDERKNLFGHSEQSAPRLDPVIPHNADEVAMAPREGNFEIDQRIIERIIAEAFPDGVPHIQGSNPDGSIQ